MKLGDCAEKETKALTFFYGGIIFSKCTNTDTTDIMKP